MRKLFLLSFLCIASAAISLAQLKVLPTTGYVGIGTLNPTTILYIKGATPFVTLRNYSTSKTWQMGINSSDFWIVDSISGTRLCIKNTTGNVGIGTTTPPALFTVGNGNLFQVNSSGIVRSVFGSASTPTYSFTGGTNTGMYSSAAGILNFSTGGTERMRVDGSGNVAIGASTISGVKFYVYGGLHRLLYTGSSINFELWAIDPRIYSPSNRVVFYNTPGGNYVDIEARNFYQSSDLSMKTNILNLNNSLDKVLQLRGVSYNWINDTLNSKVNTGFIAQEVEQIIPELVITNDSTQNKLLNYIGLMPYLVEAIKDQNTIITQQGLEILQLKARLDECCKPAIPATGN